jgi:hypothetical protein
LKKNRYFSATERTGKRTRQVKILAVMSMAIEVAAGGVH